MEMSPEPEKALPAAAVLRRICPAAGHLLHMPSHIDVLVGDYEAAMATSQLAQEADEKIWAAGKVGGIGMFLGYMAHDYDMGVYAALLAGCERKARDWHAALRLHVTDELILKDSRQAQTLETHPSTFLHILVRFGRWDELLALPMPTNPAVFCATTAMQRYARGVALAATGDVAGAEREQALFQEARMAKDIGSRKKHNVLVTQMIDIASLVLSGEILYRRGGKSSRDAAFGQLRQAVVLDDALPYDEPWGWMMPTRHVLGALLLEAGETQEAIQVYRADLAPGRHPKNVWSLAGLKEGLLILERAGADVASATELSAVSAELEVAAAVSDLQVFASCACATTKWVSSCKY